MGIYEENIPRIGQRIRNVLEVKIAPEAKPGLDQLLNGEGFTERLSCGENENIHLRVKISHERNAYFLDAILIADGTFGEIHGGELDVLKGTYSKAGFEETTKQGKFGIEYIWKNRKYNMEIVFDERHIRVTQVRDTPWTRESVGKYVKNLESIYESLAGGTLRRVKRPSDEVVAVQMDVGMIRERKEEDDEEDDVKPTNEPSPTYKFNNPQELYALVEGAKPDKPCFPTRHYNIEVNYNGQMMGIYRLESMIHLSVPIRGDSKPVTFFDRVTDSSANRNYKLNGQEDIPILIGQLVRDAIIALEYKPERK